MTRVMKDLLRSTSGSNIPFRSPLSPAERVAGLTSKGMEAGRGAGLDDLRGRVTKNVHH